MQIAGLFIFTLLWSTGVLFFDGLMARSFFKQLQSGHFPSVAGQVTHSELKSHRGSKGGTSYEAVIQYRFEAGGRSYDGSRLRYNPGPSDAATAGGLVASHPAGATVPVYYNPSDPKDSLLLPGVIGQDLFMVLFLTPFNAVMFGFWLGLSSSLRERIFRPAAGGMKIMADDMATRVRLPPFPAFAVALITTGGLGFISVFIVGFSTKMQPSMGFVLGAIAVVYLAGVAMYLWQQRKINSGIDDFVIHHAARTIDLPQTYGRKQRMTANFADIELLQVQKKVHTNSKGAVSYTYAPTLTLRGIEPPQQALADWSDKVRADDFTVWLRKQLGLPGAPDA